MISRTYLAVLSLVLVTPAASADTPKADKSTQVDSESPRWSAGVFVGWNQVSDQSELGNSAFDDQVPGSGILFGIRGDYILLPALAPSTSLDPRLAVELEMKFALASTSSNATAMRESFSSPIFGWRAHALVDIWHKRKLRPFMLLGFGGETVTTSSPDMASGDTDAAVYWGAGAAWKLAPAHAVRVDLRHLFTAGRTSSFSQTFEFHLGYSFSFGAGGNKASKPKKPRPVKHKPIKQPPNSSLPADFDKDGIPDAKDLCPKQAEIANQIDDDDGCPEVDSDGDGLLGTRDKCPDAKEDVDGYQDDDGCPDPDDDNDGRPDVVDKCKTEPETLNGYMDDDGCPDEVPPKIKEFTGIIQGIKFRTNSAKIRRSSRRTLDKAVAIMMEHKTIRLLIEGHTDNQGPAGVNQKLSQDRANAVKAYLVSKGVDAKRVDAKGFGLTNPIADNNTRRGRKKNRRIEFKLVPGPVKIEVRGDAAPPAIKDATPAKPKPAPTATPTKP